jgi:glyoxylase-like metal-dependent hydrolase (beta-lactamase superfamily II)
VIGDREVVVIDPAADDPDERAVLDHALDLRIAEGVVVREIWLTHHHRDHVAGAAHLAARLGVPIAAHPETMTRIRGTVPVSRGLGEGETLELGGAVRRQLRCLFTPGHAPGHLCFLETETGFVVAGDMIAGVGTIPIDPSEGNMADYLESLARLRDLGPAVILPAHGGAITDAQERLQHTIDHRLWREERVVAALAGGGATVAELVPRVYSDVPASVHPLAERSLMAHLSKLEGEGRARRVGQDAKTWTLTAQTPVR